MAIKTRFVREGLLYTKKELKDTFDFHQDSEFEIFLRQLKKYRILKTKRFKQSDEDESLLDDDDEDYIDDTLLSDDIKLSLIHI